MSPLPLETLETNFELGIAISSYVCSFHSIASLATTVFAQTQLQLGSYVCTSMHAQMKHTLKHLHDLIPTLVGKIISN